jgi:hypothetical protein
VTIWQHVGLLHAFGVKLCVQLQRVQRISCLGFEVFTAVTMKDAIFWTFTRPTRRLISEDGNMLLFISSFVSLDTWRGARGCLVEVLCYKLQGRGFDFL